jgi:hypothetical protein
MAGEDAMDTDEQQQHGQGQQEQRQALEELDALQEVGAAASTCFG